MKEKKEDNSPSLSRERERKSREWNERRAKRNWPNKNQEEKQKEKKTRLFFFPLSLRSCRSVSLTLFLSGIWSSPSHRKKLRSGNSEL